MTDLPPGLRRGVLHPPECRLLCWGAGLKCVAVGCLFRTQEHADQLGLTLASTGCPTRSVCPMHLPSTPPLWNLSVSMLYGNCGSSQNLNRRLFSASPFSEPLGLCARWPESWSCPIVPNRQEESTGPQPWVSSSLVCHTSFSAGWGAWAALLPFPPSPRVWRTRLSFTLCPLPSMGPVRLTRWME